MTIVTTQSVGKGISFSFERGIQGYIDIDVSLLLPVVFGSNFTTQGLERKYPMTFLSGDTISFTSEITSSPDFSNRILTVICF